MISGWEWGGGRAGELGGRKRHMESVSATAEGQATCPSPFDSQESLAYQSACASAIASLRRGVSAQPPRERRADGERDGELRLSGEVERAGDERGGEWEGRGEELAYLVAEDLDLAVATMEGKLLVDGVVEGVDLNV